MFDQEDRGLFGAVVLHIREFGYEYRWWGRAYTQLRIGDFAYWTMGDPLECTIVINRKPWQRVEEDRRTGRGR